MHNKALSLGSDKVKARGAEKVLVQNSFLSQMPLGSQIPKSSFLIDVEITSINMTVLFGFLFHLDGMCKLINKNMGYMGQEKERFSVVQLTDTRPAKVLFSLCPTAARHSQWKLLLFMLLVVTVPPEERT